MYFYFQHVLQGGRHGRKERVWRKRKRRVGEDAMLVREEGGDDQMGTDQGEDMDVNGRTRSFA